MHEMFLNHIKAAGRKNKTIESYRDVFAAFKLFCVTQTGDKPSLSKLTGLDLRTWKSDMITRRQAPTTVNHRIGVLKHFAEWAARIGHFTQIQLESIRAVPELPLQRLGVVTLEAEQLRRFLRAVEMSPSRRDQAIIHLLLSGLRVSEVVGLRIQDVSVSANRGLVEVRGEHVKRSAHRAIPLGRQARLFLRAYIDHVAPTGPIFMGQRGALTESGVDKIVRQYGKSVGLQTHCHLLRHQFGELYLNQNPGDLVGLQLLLGHASVDTTARHYVRKRLSDLVCAVNKIDL